MVIAGEPGIGKSRLVAALRQAIADQEAFQSQLQTSPHHTNTPLYAALQNLRQAIGFESDDDTVRRLDRLEAFVQRASTGGSEELKLLADLLGLPFEERYGTLDLSPPERKDRTIDILVDDSWCALPSIRGSFYGPGEVGQKPLYLLKVCRLSRNRPWVLPAIKPVPIYDVQVRGQEIFVQI